MMIQTEAAKTTLSTPKPALRAFSLPGKLGKKLMKLDLESVKFKLAKEEGWSLARLDAVEQLYKAWLWLLAERPGIEWVPTLDIDEMWHTHILDTQKYMADCATLFGRYIHHYPFMGLKDEADAEKAEGLFAGTLAALADLGLDLEQLAADCGGGGCSSGGCSTSCPSCSSPSCPPSSCTTYIPPASSCSSPTQPLNDRGKKKEERKPTPAPQKKPWWKPSFISRLGSEGMEHQFRPTRGELEALLAVDMSVKH